MKKIITALLCISVGYFSCKTTEVAPPLNDQNPKIQGTWSMFAIKTSLLDKDGKLSQTDSTATIKGINDDYKFIPQGFLLKDKLVQYEIIKINNDFFLVFEAYNKKNNLKIAKYSTSSLNLENTIVLTDRTMIQTFYFKKD